MGLGKLLETNGYWGKIFEKLYVSLGEILSYEQLKNVSKGIAFLPAVKDIIVELNDISLNAGSFSFSMYGWCFIYYGMSL